MQENIFRCEATRVLSEIKKSSTFLTVRHYMNNFGEISDFSIVFHINYRNAISRSFELLQQYKPSNDDCIGKPYVLTELSAGREELLQSFKLSLDAIRQNTVSPRDKTSNVYSKIGSDSGEVISGIKLHDNQDIIHLNGLRVHRNILLKGNYPADNRLVKTIAKDDLRDKLPIGRYVQFKLTPGKFRELIVCGLTIREQDVVRQIMK